MSFKTTLVLLVVAAAVVGFYFFVDKGPTTEELSKTAKRILPDWNESEVVKITIARTASPTADIVLAREKGSEDWRIEKPARVPPGARGKEAGGSPPEGGVPAEKGGTIPAMRGATQSMLALAQSADHQERYEKFDAKSLGLDAPRARVTFSRTDGKEQTLAFGREDPTGKFVYAQVEGKPDALMVPERVYDGFVKKIEDLRENRIYTVDTWTVDRLTLEGPRDQEIRFRKDGDFWMLDAKEGADHADKRKVDDLVSTLTGLRAKRFIEDGAESVEKYGLKTPLAAVTLEARGVSQTALFGGKAEGAPNEVYARAKDRLDIVSVDDKLTTQIHWDVEAWRSKNLIHIGRERIESIEVQPAAGAGKGMKLVHDGFAWTFAEPKTVTADTAAADDLARAIGEVEVVKVAREKPENLGNFGLDKPTVVTIATPKTKTSFRLGRASSRPDGWYAQRDGKDAVLEVTFPLAKTLLHAWPALREKTLATLAPDDIVRLDIAKDGGAPQPFVRLPDGSWSTPGDGKKVDVAAAEAIASEIARLEAQRILPGVDDAGAIGLERPWLAIRANVKPAPGTGAPATIAIELGKATADRERNARFTRGDETIYVTLSEDAVNVLAKDLVLKEEAPPKDVPPAGGREGGSGEGVSSSPDGDVPAPVTGSGK